MNSVSLVDAIRRKGEKVDYQEGTEASQKRTSGWGDESEMAEQPSTNEKCGVREPHETVGGGRYPLSNTIGGERVGRWVASKEEGERAEDNRTSADQSKRATENPHGF